MSVRLEKYKVRCKTEVVETIKVASSRMTEQKLQTKKVAGEFPITEEIQTEKREEGAPVLVMALVCLFPE